MMVSYEYWLNQLTNGELRIGIDHDGELRTVIIHKKTHPKLT